MTQGPAARSVRRAHQALDRRAERGRAVPARPTRDPHRLSRQPAVAPAADLLDGTRTWRGTPVLKTTTTKRLAFVVAATTMVGALAACSSNDDSSSSDTESAGTALNEINVWDPYPQNDETSDWAKYLQTCAPDGHDAHAHVGRHGRPAEQPHVRGQGGQRARRGHARQPGRARTRRPQACSPPRRTSASTPRASTRTSPVPAPSTAWTYGVPIGANTLGLYYNKKILDAAGVDPASITSWATLNDALAKVTAAGSSGHHVLRASPARRASSSSCPGSGAPVRT